MNPNVIIALIVVISIFLGVAGCKMVDRHFEKENLEEKWKEARQKAKEMGYELYLVSDDQYFKRAHPMPHGGMLYAFGGYIYVRYEHREPQDVLEFLEKK